MSGRGARHRFSIFLIPSALLLCMASGTGPTSLSQGPDSAPRPALSAVTVSPVEGGVAIAWITSEEADGIVNWGPTPAYGRHVSDFRFLRSHRITIPAGPGVHHFAVRSCLRAPKGACAESTGMRFELGPGGEVTSTAEPKGPSGDVPREERAKEPVGCLTFEEFSALSTMASEALVSDCDTGTEYCVAYTGTVIDAGTPVTDGASVTIAYSAWVIPDMSAATAQTLMDYDTGRAPVSRRSIVFTMGRSGMRGLETVLMGRNASAMRAGETAWMVMPEPLAGALRDGLPAIPPRGAVAAEVELLQVEAAPPGTFPRH